MRQSTMGAGRGRYVIPCLLFVLLGALGWLGADWLAPRPTARTAQVTAASAVAMDLGGPTVAAPEPSPLAPTPQPEALAVRLLPAPLATPTAIMTPAALPTNIGSPQASPVPTQSATPALQIFRDIRYAQIAGVDPAALSLDIYTPATSGKHPVMVYVHGGGWSGGDKSDIKSKDRLFAAAGYVFVSINYRLLPAGRHPANARDVAKALVWVADNVGRYGGDPTRLYLMGHSAGAHLSGLVTTDEQYLRAEGKSPSMLRGVILLDSNAYNIPLLMPHLTDDTNVYSVAFGKDPALWRDASPALHVAKGKGLPPFLVVHANRDSSRQEQAEDMAKRLRAAGVRADLVDIPERDHGSLCDKLGEPKDRASDDIMKFLASLETGNM